MQTHVSSNRRLGQGVADAALAMLVLVGAAHHVSDQRGLAEPLNGLWAQFAACASTSLPQRLAASFGHVFDMLVAAAVGACDFDPVIVRLPQIAFSIAALAIAAFADRSRRPWAERFLATGFLLGTVYPMYYAHHARPYAAHIAAGVAVFAFRRHHRAHAVRSGLGAAAVLSAPWAAPVWGAGLVAASVAALAAAPRGQPHRRALWPLAPEWLLLVLTVAVEVVTLKVYAAHGIAAFRYDAARQPVFYGPALQALWGWPVDAVARAGIAVMALLAVVGAWRDRTLLATAALAGMGYAVGWALFQPPAQARYLLPLVMVTPVSAAVGLPQRVLPRLALVLVIGAGWWQVGRAIHHNAAQLYRNVEGRADVAAMLAVLRDGDAIIIGPNAQLEHVLPPLLAQRALHVVLAGDPPKDMMYGLPNASSVRRALREGALPPWARTLSVQTVTAPTQAPVREWVASGRRVLVLRGSPESRFVADEPTYAALTATALVPPVVRVGAERPPERAQAACISGLGVVPWIDDVDALDVAVGGLERNETAFLRAACGRALPEATSQK